jgi:hypothetical protein
MNTLFIKSPTEQWIAIAQKLEKQYQLDPCLWIPNSKASLKLGQASFPNAAFLNHEDCMLARRPREVSAGPSFPDAKFFRENILYEEIFMKMIDRWSVNPDGISVEKRRHFYIDQIALAMTIIEFYGIELIIMPTVPHRLYDFSIYIVAKWWNIPFLMVTETNELLVHGEHDRRHLYIIINDIFDRSKFLKQAETARIPLRPELRRGLELARQPYIQSKPLFARKRDQSVSNSRRYLRWVSDRSPTILKIITYLIIEGVLNKTSLRKRLFFPYLKKEGLSPTWSSIPAAVRYHDTIKRRVRYAAKWYTQHAIKPDLSVKYIYVAASKQPERSSTPDAGLFQWHELMLEILCAAIPDDWFVYYKEHPTNFLEPVSIDNSLNTGTLYRISALSENLRFVSVESDPMELIDRAQCVATTTGTTAWQAVARGKYALVFGHAWYNTAPGIIPIKTLTECQAAFAYLSSANPVASLEIENYLKTLDMTAGEFEWLRDIDRFKALKRSPRAYGNALEHICELIMRSYRDSYERQINVTQN